MTTIAVDSSAVCCPTWSGKRLDFKSLKARGEDGDGNVGKTITLITHDKKNT